MKTCTLKPGVEGLTQSLRHRIPLELLDDEPDDLVAAGLTREQKIAQRERAVDQFRRGRNPRTVREQPRDYRGRFRDILARLKVNLGESELNQVVKRVEDAENAEQRNDYGKAADAATDVIQLVDRIDAGSLDGKQLNNIKATARELGKTIAYLPLPQGDPNATLRFSDLPPTTQELLNNMRDRIKKKLTPEKAAKVLLALSRFTSGTIQLTSDQLQSELSKLLAYLIG